MTCAKRPTYTNVLTFDSSGNESSVNSAKFKKMGNDLTQYNVLTVRKFEQARNGLGYSLPTRIEILDDKPPLPPLIISID